MPKSDTIIANTVNAQSQYTPLLANTEQSSASHISLPPGAALSSYTESITLSKQFAQSISIFDSNSAIKAHEMPLKSPNPTSSELSFGAPQIDLALPQGALTSNGLHELNPTHYRDQSIAFSCALALAARRKHQSECGPIVCFLSETETWFKKSLSEETLKSLNLKQEDVILVTAKHNDDLLWGMEETLREGQPSTVIGHVALLDNLAAQRLNSIASDAGIPCIIIANHKSAGNPHSITSWAIHEAEPINRDKVIPAATISLENCKLNMPTGSWTIVWHTAEQRFSASSIATDTGKPANTIH